MPVSLLQAAIERFGPIFITAFGMTEAPGPVVRLTQDDLVRSENGWRVAPGDLEALAAVLGSALSDVGRLRAMGAASFRIVLEEANLESMASVFVQAANALYNPQIMSYNRTRSVGRSL